MLFFISILFLLLTIVTTGILVIRDVSKPPEVKQTVVTATDVSINDELNINKYYIYHVDGDKSLQSMLGSDNPIHFEKVGEDAKVFKMTLDGYDLGYIGNTGMVISKQMGYVGFLPINFKLQTTGNDEYIITSVPGDKYLYYDRVVDTFFLIDPELINSEYIYNFIKLRLERG